MAKIWNQEKLKWSCITFQIYLHTSVNLYIKLYTYIYSIIAIITHIKKYAPICKYMNGNVNITAIYVKPHFNANWYILSTKLTKVPQIHMFAWSGTNMSIIIYITRHTLFPKSSNAYKRIRMIIYTNSTKMFQKIFS